MLFIVAMVKVSGRTKLATQDDDKGSHTKLSKFHVPYAFGIWSIVANSLCKKLQRNNFCV